MNNYEYIIAGLPVLSPDWTDSDTVDPALVVEEIKGQLSKKDLKTFNFLMDGFDRGKLCEDFYREALSHPDGFIRKYFKLDLNVRNAKVEYLNRVLGRPEDTDRLMLSDDGFEDRERVDSILMSEDILYKEKELDRLMWDGIESINWMNVFDLDAVLGFTAKLMIVGRWLKLDPVTGKEMFRKLVAEIRNNRDK